MKLISRNFDQDNYLYLFFTLQKQEQKQFQDLAFKNQLCKEQQDKRFEQERTILVKNYENDLQSMIDQQKKQVEKAEEQQHVDLKVTSKKIRADQEKELKNFRYELRFCIMMIFFFKLVAKMWIFFNYVLFFGLQRISKGRKVGIF